MLQIIVGLFLTGLTLGMGPCMASCGPVLVTYVAGTKENWAGGLRSYLIFSAGRVCVYLFLGVLSGLFGEVFTHLLYDSKFGLGIWIAGGLFIIILGVLTITGASPKWHPFGKLFNFTIRNDIKSLFLLGILIGFSPCGPLLGVLSYIALVSKTLFHGFLYSAAFAVGSVVSPLILLAAFAGFIPQKLITHPKVLKYFRVIAGAILVYLGVRVLLIPWFSAYGAKG